MNRKVLMIGPFATEVEDEKDIYGYSPAGNARFRFIYELFKELGCEIFIVSTFLSCNERFYENRKKRVWRGTTVFRSALLSVTIPSILVCTLSTIFYLRRLLSKKKVDFIYIYNPYLFTGLPALYAKWAFGTKIVLDYEDLVASEAMKNLIYRAIMKQAESWIVNRIDGCLACAEPFQRLLKPDTPFLILRGISAEL